MVFATSTTIDKVDGNCVSHIDRGMISLSDLVINVTLMMPRLLEWDVGFL